MIYSAVAFAWIGGIVIVAGVMVPATAVVNGVCYSGYFFLSQAARRAVVIWNFLSFYVIILLIFIFCYGRILMAIRRQVHVMAAHSGEGPSTAQNQPLNKIQTSVIKTMILVSGLFTVAVTPVYIYTLLVIFDKIVIDEITFYSLISVAYLYVCVNPFIYATKFDPVKRVLLGLIPCKKFTQHATQSGVNT